MNTAGERIRYIRTQLGVSQEAFGKAIGQNRLAVARWESGDQEPRPVQLRVLSQILRIPSGWLVEGQGEPPKVDESTEEALREAKEKAQFGMGVPSLRVRRERSEANPRHPLQQAPPLLPPVENLLLSISARIAALMSERTEWPIIPGISQEMMTAFAKQRAIPSMRMIAAFAEAFGVQEDALLYGQNPVTGKILKP